jgi:hypothetical protein
MNSTAAIHYKNGTTMPIAQIPGSPEYQAFMRRNSTTPVPDSTLCQWLSPALGRLPSAISSDIDVCRSADLVSTKALLSLLKASVESHLGTNICFASLVLDDPSSPHAKLAEQALSTLGLTQVMATTPRARRVLHSLQPDSAPAYDEEPWTVLVLEYDAHWYSFGLYTIEEDGVTSPIEGYVHTPRIEVDGQMDALKKELKELFANMPQGVERTNDIRHLFVYGEDADNAELLDFLAENVGSSVVNARRTDASVYAGTSYMAWASYSIMDDVQFETSDLAKDAWICKWRSKLYLEDREEL